MSNITKNQTVHKHRTVHSKTSRYVCMCVYISDVHCVVRAPSSTFCYLHLYKCVGVCTYVNVLDYSTENITLLLVNLMAPHIQFTFRTKLFLCLIYGEIYKHIPFSRLIKGPRQLMTFVIVLRVIQGNCEFFAAYIYLAPASFDYDV